ncbi:hypothetical protein ACFX13_017817 [Malus domestica]|uniref:FBD domain-containing protein n=1 Tax=Malus domestica TaxID=3750 RepID=A0A498HWJ5_MALDO|nr:hypothetical protein DVH24_029063 [Malus domestica]
MVLSFVKLFSLVQLVIGSNVEIAKIEKSSQWPRQNLKLVQIAVYNGRKFCVKQVKYLMKNAVVLEKIVINLVRFWCLSTGIESKFLRENEITVQEPQVVEIVGYHGHGCCINHVRYFIVALEKMVINPVQSWRWPMGIESNALRENEENNAKRMQVLIQSITSKKNALYHRILELVCMY